MWAMWEEFHFKEKFEKVISEAWATRGNIVFSFLTIYLVLPDKSLLYKACLLEFPLHPSLFISFFGSLFFRCSDSGGFVSSKFFEPAFARFAWRHLHAFASAGALKIMANVCRAFEGWAGLYKVSGAGSCDWMRRQHLTVNCKRKR